MKRVPGQPVPRRILGAAGAALMLALASCGVLGPRRPTDLRRCADVEARRAWVRTWSEPVGRVFDRSGYPLRVVRRVDGSEMIFVAPGQFIQGIVGDGDDSPAHPVQIESAFYMDSREISSGQWLLIMGRLPEDVYTHTDGYDATRAAVGISFFEATEYARRVGAALPTESEWEYTARLGSNEWDFPWGPEDNVSLRNLSLSRPRGITSSSTHLPQISGFYDLIGNAMEWCSDVYAPYGRPMEARRSVPTGEARGERVLRGGDCATPSAHDLIARRDHLDPAIRDSTAGFRCVIRVP